ncbi:unnamed protein product [Linum tenue]|uniref:Uncharacterized protein n=1 Tax=Linum tenue TaxID=586396 RepID=A0AAV0L7F8_9ROSI|nr:unnamed protein product [Linum tenue]
MLVSSFSLQQFLHYPKPKPHHSPLAVGRPLNFIQSSMDSSVLPLKRFSSHCSVLVWRFSHTVVRSLLRLPHRIASHGYLEVAF